MRLAVARIGRPHGVKGEATIETFTDTPEERFFPGARLECDAPSHPILEVIKVRTHQGRWMLTFAEVTDRSAVERLRNFRLYCDVEIKDQSDVDSYHVEALRGLKVVDIDEAVIGTVMAVRHLPGQDLLAVENQDGEYLIPMVHEFITEIDIDQGLIRVNLPEGLVE